MGTWKEPKLHDVYDMYSLKATAIGYGKNRQSYKDFETIGRL